MFIGLTVFLWNSELSVRLGATCQPNLISTVSLVYYRHGVLHKPSTSVKFWPKFFHKNSVIFDIFAKQIVCDFRHFWHNKLRVFSEGYRRYLTLWLTSLVSEYVRIYFLVMSLCLKDQAYNFLIHFYKRDCYDVMTR